MARIRTVKPEFWCDEKVGLSSDAAKLVMLNRMNFADDLGRFRAHPRGVAAECWPYDGARATRKAEKALEELSESGMVELYEVNGERFGWFPRWSVHQKINRPSGAKLPAPDDGSVSPHGAFAEGSQRDPDPDPEHDPDHDREQELGDESSSTLRDLYGELRAGTDWPACRSFTPSRKRAATARIKEFGLDGVREAWAAATRSGFLTDPEVRNASPEHGTWRPDIDWFLKADTITKLLEGKYGDDGAAPPEPDSEGRRAACAEKFACKSADLEYDAETGGYMLPSTEGAA